MRSGEGGGGVGYLSQSTLVASKFYTNVAELCVVPTEQVIRVYDVCTYMCVLACRSLHIGLHSWSISLAQAIPITSVCENGWGGSLAT